MTRKFPLYIISMVIGLINAVVGAVLLLACAVVPAMAGDASVPHFESDIRPIMKAMCFHCHGEETELAGGLDLRLVRLMKEGGDSGEAITAADPDESVLWLRIESDEMPEGPKKLTADEKSLIRRWIQAGSPTVREESANSDDAKYTLEELNFWSFQPVANVAIPKIDGLIINPIDAFVVDKLHTMGMRQSSQADKAVLLRRVTLDLTGLPPTPEELTAFLSDESPNAYEKVVDRLLSSDAFGIRWGRHWLDIAGFSETAGYLADDISRPHAWRYRDYVIDSINADKPYDQFVTEQLAGDELIAEMTAGGKPNPDDALHVELMTATGFLQMAPDLTKRQDTISDRNQVVAETIKVVSSAVLGLTVGCAQCHDHRYDPISAKDYYSMRAVFDPAFPLEHWLKPEDRVLDMTGSADAAAIGKIESVVKQRESELQAKRLEVAKGIYQRLVGELPDDKREELVALVAKAEGDRTDDEISLLKQYPMLTSIEAIAGMLAVYDQANHQKFFQEENAIQSLRESGPPQRLVMCVHETDSKIPDSMVFSRGDPLSPKEKVLPSEVFVLARNRPENTIPLNQDMMPTTGRRLAYARQWFDGTHPTIARVAVNRIWAHHFGSGLVSTTSDFGLFGELPTHPELLDWLAVDFVGGGWAMKRLHRMIVMSHTFRQTSHRTPESDDHDPQNQFLSRMNMRRLDAEEIRDAILMVTGLLNRQAGGPSVPVALEQDGHVVVGRAVLNNGGLFDRIDDVGVQKYRRSIFIANERINALTMLATFDAPVMSPNCDARSCSTVAPQSLWFLNDSLIVDVTDKLADRMFSEKYANEQDRIRDLFVRLFSASPSETEMRQCVDYLKAQSDELRKYQDEDWVKLVQQFGHAPDVAAYATLCQALLSTNRFLYVE